MSIKQSKTQSVGCSDSSNSIDNNSGASASDIPNKLENKMNIHVKQPTVSTTELLNSTHCVEQDLKSNIGANDRRIAKIVDRQVALEKEVDRLFLVGNGDEANDLLGQMNDASMELTKISSDGVTGLLKKLEWLSSDVNNNGKDISGAPIAEKVLSDIFAEARKFSDGDSEITKSHESTSGDKIQSLYEEILPLETRALELEEPLHYRNTETQQTFHQSEYRHVLDRIDALWDAISASKADSIESVNIQLAGLDRIFHRIEGFENEASERESLVRHYRRLFHSVFSYLNSDPTLSVNDHMNPWLAFEDRLEIIDEPCATQ